MQGMYYRELFREHLDIATFEVLPDGRIFDFSDPYI
jgi:hypothetical protein